MNAIHIKRLDFKGRKTQQRRVIADLEDVAWPAMPERAFLFIKRLQAHKPAGQLAQSLAEQAVAYQGAAVQGWQYHADSAHAVYFSDYAELLACLTRDILHKNRCWYWQQWDYLFAQPVETALINCWHQHQNLIPSIVEQLAQHQQLGWFCRQLSSNLARQLCFVVCPQLDVSYAEHPASPTKIVMPIPQHWLTPWQPVFKDTALDLAVMQLAALIVLKQWQPLKLLQDDGLQTFDAVLAGIRAIAAGKNQSNMIDDQHQHPTQAKQTAKHRDIFRFDDSEIPVLKNPANEQVLAGQTEGTIPDFIQDKPKPTAEILETDQINHDQQTLISTDQYINAHQVENRITRPVRQSIPKSNSAQPIVNSTYRILSGQGGVFYLLNFLNLPKVQDSLLSHPISQQYSSAWGWLWQLVITLGWQPEPALVHLFAFFCGFDDDQQLSQLPALPQMDDLLCWGRQRYGEQLFNQALFSVESMIEIDTGHVEVFYAANAIRLDVRRVGLDIDPGWLPWLGKVVKFHYGALPI